VVTLADIEAARDRIRGGVYYSPCVESIPLSQLTGAHIYCKLDYLQRTGSFKERGARNALLKLTADARKLGVIAASAGNHAQGIAYHAKLLGIPATVVMPKFAALVKVTNCRQFGANVVLHGADLTEARAHAGEIAAREGLTFIHPFDNADVIAGQGTMGLEILEQTPDVDAIVVPVGGGGLIAGIGTAVKAKAPHVEIVGVEPERAACLTAALAQDEPTLVPLSHTLADGLAVAKVGDAPFGLMQRVVDRVVTVDEATIALAILRLIELEKSVVEGAGAAPLAAFLAGRLDWLKGKRAVLVLAGGNIDSSALGRIIDVGARRGRPAVPLQRHDQRSTGRSRKARGADSGERRVHQGNRPRPGVRRPGSVRRARRLRGRNDGPRARAQTARGAGGRRASRRRGDVTRGSRRCSVRTDSSHAR
jgi:threonine dehydratase